MVTIIASGKRWFQTTGMLPFRRGYDGISIGGSVGGTDLTGYVSESGPVVYKLTGRVPQAYDAAYMGRWLPLGYWTTAEEETVVVPWHLLMAGVH